MKLLIDKDEWYPVYTAFERSQSYSDFYWDQYEREWPAEWSHEEYLKCIQEFDNWQGKLSKLYKNKLN